MEEVTNIIKRYLERFKAFFVDWLIILFPNVLLWILLETIFKKEEVSGFFELTLGLTYFGYFTFFTTKGRQTLGKKLMKLKVVDIVEIDAVTLKTSIYRHIPILLFFTLSALIAIQSQRVHELNSNIYNHIPGLWLIAEIVFYLIRNNGQMLHDYIAGTTVIKSK